MKNLKEIAKKVSEDMMNQAWFEREVSFVLDGSHNSGYRTQEHIADTIDTTKKNYGKRGSNLIAFCGNAALQDIYEVNANQALSIWKYLNKQEQGYFNALICELLEEIEISLKD
jgi:glutamine amidotransferase-like uncharacterized protein